MAESVQRKLTRIRPPRVSISYDVEINGSRKFKELPFVMAILADLSGDKYKTKRKIKGAMKFEEINKANFDIVVEKINPTLSIKVPNKLSNDGSSLAMSLNFKKFKDFTPDMLAQNIPELKQLMDTRYKLLDFQASVDSNSKLEEIMARLANDPEKIKQLLSAPKATENKPDDGSAAESNPTDGTKPGKGG